MGQTQQKLYIFVHFDSASNNLNQSDWDSRKKLSTDILKGRYIENKLKYNCKKFKNEDIF